MTKEVQTHRRGVEPYDSKISPWDIAKPWQDGVQREEGDGRRRTRRPKRERERALSSDTQRSKISSCEWPASQLFLTWKKAEETVVMVSNVPKVYLILVLNNSLEMGCSSVERTARIIITMMRSISTCKVEIRNSNLHIFVFHLNMVLFWLTLVKHSHAWAPDESHILVDHGD